MRLSSEDLSELAELASEAAQRAGQLIAESRPSVIDHKAQGGSSAASQVVTDIDRAAERIILQVLQPTVARFELGVLTEERDDDRSRRTQDHFWCIDPLDGTLPFIEGRAGYAVSIALVRRDGRPRIGVVFDPVHGVLYRAVDGRGMTCDGRAFSVDVPAHESTLSVFFDRSFVEHPDHATVVQALEEYAPRMGLSGVAFHTGSGAVMNACGALRRGPGCYFKFPKTGAGGGSVWDFAATACMFQESGGVATDIHGDALDLNRVDGTFMNHRGVLFATQAPLARRIEALYRTLI